jgi:hypothetical protein
MNGKLLLKISCYCLVLSMFAFSCQTDEKISAQDTNDVKEEAEADAYFQETDDLAGVAVVSLSESDYNGGRVNVTINDQRVCNTATTTLTRDPNSTLDNPKGTITIDFGTDGCTDQYGNTRKGKIMFAFSGKRFMTGSSVTTTFDNYYINDIKLDGIRTITNTTGSSAAAPKYNIVLQNGKATFSDNTTAERASNINVSWVRAASPLNDELLVEVNSTATGKTRGGRTYTVTVLKQLVYKRFCKLAVEGAKKYQISGSPDIQIDYGSGDCDKAVVITENGLIKNISYR